MSLVVLGDLHFRDDKDYFVKTSEEFLRWFDKWDQNNSNNSLILAGDLVETSLLSGNVADYLERFINYSKFDNVHICVGNHDKKKFHNEDQLAYEFYKNKSNVKIYERATEVKIQGKNVLILPYYTGINSKGLSMSEYYSNISNNSKDFLNNYDLVVGHFCGEDLSFYGSAECVFNLDKINTKKIILGHIHTRSSNPNMYIGSVFAGKKTENDCTRSALILEDDEWREERLPLFNEFLTVSYPDPLPKTTAIVPIYTILDCASEAVARTKYKNIFIKRVTSDSVDFGSKKSTDLDRQFSSIKDMEINQLFAAFVKSQDPPLDKIIEEDCYKLLNIH